MGEGEWAPDLYIDVHGLRIRYRRWGTVGGVPLLLVNGIGAGLEMWAPFVAELDGRDVVALDLPGSGLSDAPSYPVGMRWFADRTAMFLDALSIDRADVLGFSFGGAVAQQFALAHAGRIRRLALVSTTPGIPAMPGSPLALLAASTPLRYFDPSLGRLLVPHMVGGRTYRDRRVLEAEMPLRQEQPPTWWGYLVQLSAIATWSSNLWLRKLSVPTLVLHGDDDRLCPVTNARWMASVIPDCEFIELPRAGHLLVLDEPRLAADTILGFLGVDAQPARPPKSSSAA